MLKEAYLYQQLENLAVRCQTCAHNCFLKINQDGLCGVRKNIQGKLFVLNYGRAVAAAIDPIEKKPLYHFMPGTFTFSVAAAGCNFRCLNCQNWEISQVAKNKNLKKADIEKLGYDLPPEKIIEEAIKAQCPSISYTYSEPTVFLEWAFETMKIAKEKGLKNIWVSNGFMSQKTLNLILPYLDAANIDLKSFDDNFYRKVCGAQLEPVLKNLKFLKKAGIHLEITTLIIPSFSDNLKMIEKIACFIKSELGAETPWHLSRFFPDISFSLKNLPATPLETLKKAKLIGLKLGLKNIYLGNI